MQVHVMRTYTDIQPKYQNTVNSLMNIVQKGSYLPMFVEISFLLHYYYLIINIITYVINYI